MNSSFGLPLHEWTFVLICQGSSWTLFGWWILDVERLCDKCAHADYEDFAAKVEVFVLGSYGSILSGLFVLGSITVVVVLLAVRGGRTHLERAMHGQPPGWYWDPVHAGTVTYWTGRKWDWRTRRPAQESILRRY